MSIWTVLFLAIAVISGWFGFGSKMKGLTTAARAVFVISLLVIVGSVLIHIFNDPAAVN